MSYFSLNCVRCFTTAMSSIEIEIEATNTAWELKESANGTSSANDLSFNELLMILTSELFKVSVYNSDSVQIKLKNNNSSIFTLATFHRTSRMKISSDNW